MTWQPIATAPKGLSADDVLLYGTDDEGDPQMWVSNAEYAQPSEWYGARLLTPTHWMPLPEPPQTSDAVDR